MPYIKQQARIEFSLDQNRWAQNPGELNYNFTMAVALYGPGSTADIIIREFIMHYLEDNGKSYQTINDVAGATYCACMEMERRGVENYKEINYFMAGILNDFYHLLAASYEDKKIIENGDLEVYKGVK
jgi:hypothetical protein